MGLPHPREGQATVEAGRQRTEGQTQQLCHVGSQETWASFCNTEAVMEEPRGRRTASCWLGRMLGSEWRRYLSKDKTEKKKPRQPTDPVQFQLECQSSPDRQTPRVKRKCKGSRTDKTAWKNPKLRMHVF